MLETCQESSLRSKLETQRPGCVVSVATILRVVTYDNPEDKDRGGRILTIAPREVDAMDAEKFLAGVEPS